MIWHHDKSINTWHGVSFVINQSFLSALNRNFKRFTHRSTLHGCEMAGRANCGTWRIIASLTPILRYVLWVVTGQHLRATYCLGYQKPSIGHFRSIETLLSTCLPNTIRVNLNRFDTYRTFRLHTRNIKNQQIALELTTTSPVPYVELQLLPCSKASTCVV